MKRTLEISLLGLTAAGIIITGISSLAVIPEQQKAQDKRLEQLESDAKTLREDAKTNREMLIRIEERLISMQRELKTAK